MKIGTMNIPHHRLGDLLEIPGMFYGKFGFDPIEGEIASKMMGYSGSNNGAYIRKVADLRAYGLLNPRGKIQVSELGRKVAFPEDDEERQAGLFLAFKNVEVYALIYEKYGKNPSTDLWPDLIKWTKAKPNEAQELEQKLKNAYLYDVRLINEVPQITKKIEAYGESEPPKFEAKASTLSSEKVDEIKSAPGKLITKYGSVFIVNMETAKIAQAYIDLIVNEFSKVENRKTEELKPENTEK